MKNKKIVTGFTLIELLIVIAIIGLLASIVTTSLLSARIKGRDAKRKGDFQAISSAMQLYFSTYNTYPPEKPQTACGGTDAWASSNGTCGGQWLTTDNNFYTFMGSVPKDPLNTGINAGWSTVNYVYSYYPALGGRDYELVTQLENSADSSRCATKIAYYHNTSVPWCAPWTGNLGRNGSIFTDH